VYEESFLQTQHKLHEQFEATHRITPVYLDIITISSSKWGLWFDSQSTGMVGMALRDTSVLLKFFLIAC
jgi:hypothetical protein